MRVMVEDVAGHVESRGTSRLPRKRMYRRDVSPGRREKAQTKHADYTRERPALGHDISPMQVNAQADAPLKYLAGDAALPGEQSRCVPEPDEPEISTGHLLNLRPRL